MIIRNLLLALLIGNVFLKFFTNYLRVLPKILNIFDVMVVAIFVLIFLRYLPSIKHLRFPGILVSLILLNVVFVVGSVLNTEFLHLPAAISQAIMLNEPIILFLILVNLPFTLSDINRYDKLLYNIIIIQFVIGILQIPIYAITGESESILGTFYHNAEQYVGFLLIGVIYMVAKAEFIRSNRNNYYLLSASISLLIFIVDTKAIWLGVLVSILFVTYLLNRLNTNYLIKFRFVLLITTISTTGYWAVNTFSGSLHKIEKFEMALKSENFFELRKIKAYEDVFTAYSKYPYMSLVGSGLGNFYSRASYQFFSGKYDKTAGTRAKKQYKTSDSMGGVIARTEKEPFYLQFERGRGYYDYFFMGTAQLDLPHSSYAGVLGESGVLGFIIYTCVYLTILFRLMQQAKKHKKNSHIFPLILSSIGFMIFILTVSAFNPWMETGRMTTILWSMIAIVFLFDYQFSRHRLVIKHQIKNQHSKSKFPENVLIDKPIQYQSLNENNNVE